MGPQAYASDHSVESKYSKVLQTALYQQNMLLFEFQNGRCSTPETPPPPGCATASRVCVTRVCVRKTLVRKSTLPWS